MFNLNSLSVRNEMQRQLRAEDTIRADTLRFCRLKCVSNYSRSVSAVEDKCFFQAGAFYDVWVALDQDGNFVIVFPFEDEKEPCKKRIFRIPAAYFEPFAKAIPVSETSLYGKAHALVYDAQGEAYLVEKWLLSVIDINKAYNHSSLQECKIYPSLFGNARNIVLGWCFKGEDQTSCLNICDPDPKFIPYSECRMGGERLTMLLPLLSEAYEEGCLLGGHLIKLGEEDLSFFFL